MSRPIIVCDRLSKQYNLGATRDKGILSGMPPTLREVIAQAAGRRQHPAGGP